MNYLDQSTTDLVATSFEVGDGKYTSFEFDEGKFVGIKEDGIELGVLSPQHQELIATIRTKVASQRAKQMLLKVDFMQLFTLSELTDITDLQKGDPTSDPVITIDKNVRTAMTIFDEAERVDLTKPVVKTFVGYLASLDSPNRAGTKVTTAARIKKILVGEAPTSVI